MCRLGRKRRNATTTVCLDDGIKENTLGRKQRRKDKGALECISPKFRKDVKRLIRELGLEFVSVEKVEPDTG